MIQRTFKKGDFIGQEYEVYNVLGEGGFGIVYLVYSHRTKSAYALKTFRDEYLEDVTTRERFKKEAQVWIDLERHPYIVRVSFVDEIYGRLFIVMEYIAPDEQGLNSLDAYLRHSPPDLVQSLRWAIQFCHGMEWAFSKGIKAHRDIKPANIMIDLNKSVKISDFGLAGVIGSSRITSEIKLDIQKNRVGFSCQTIEGIGFGTPTHMSPEQFINALGCDERSDIYSFGIVLYQMLSGGKLPFLAQLPRNNSYEESRRFWFEMYILHSKAPVPILNTPLFPVIFRCLGKNPIDRYFSFRELRRDLEKLLKNLTGEVVKLPELKELEPWEWFNKGASLSCLGKHHEAIACYEKVLEIHPMFADAWNNKGAALFNLGKFQEAISCFDSALEINPIEVGAWNNKGNALSKLGKSQDEIACYDKALEINPKCVEAWNNKGQALSKFGKFQDQIACYEKALDINPMFATAWNNKGNVLFNLGKFQDAIACVDSALEINPMDADAWYNKGVALVELNKPQEAIACFENALKINPRYAEAWYNKGVLLGVQGRYKEALKCFDRTLKLKPRDEKAWYYKGQALSDLGKSQDAIACYEKALEINPMYAKAWYNRGCAFAKLGKHQVAIEAFENFVRFAQTHYATQVAEVKAWIQKIKKEKKGL